ncbi:hypothetical protein [Ferrovum myxofaciens]|uniref:hypothetical protein n=1 Tax=Ferrovum myxofaciens TaxID=416213 RepID=UPI00235596F6|nr:hypothetical protein [Ferrovum myxofaciens]
MTIIGVPWKSAGYKSDKILVWYFVANFNETGRGKTAFPKVTEVFINAVFEDIQRFYADESGVFQGFLVSMIVSYVFIRRFNKEIHKQKQHHKTV